MSYSLDDWFKHNVDNLTAITNKRVETQVWHSVCKTCNAVELHDSEGCLTCQRKMNEIVYMVCPSKSCRNFNKLVHKHEVKPIYHLHGKPVCAKCGEYLIPNVNSHECIPDDEVPF